MIRLNDILQRVASYHPEPDLDVIKKAYVYSAKVHQGQIRKSGEPYLVHLGGGGHPGATEAGRVFDRDRPVA